MTKEIEIMPDAYLEWIDGRQQVQRLEIVDKVFIGRTCKGVDCQKRIILDEPLVSRDHAVISRDVTQLSITDSSKNGTWVNATRMASGSTKDLVGGDRIRIGELSFRVIYVPTDSPTQEEGTNTETTLLRTAEVVVTSLIADVREFSEFSQTHTSTEVYALIKEIFERFSIVVDDFQGTIKDYAGDAVFAYWDHEAKSQKDQAVLACRAALEQMKILNRILIELSAKFQGAEQLQMGWGITTGKVTISHYGSLVAEPALVGDSINLGFRLSGMANKERADKIIMCFNTAALVQTSFLLKDLGEFSVKGRKGREHIFALVG
jgi:class 3 adenylate cyclase